MQDFSSLTRDPACAPCIGSVESYPLDFQGSPLWWFFKKYLFICLFVLAALGLSCGMQDLVPWPGTEPGPPALGVWRSTHWTTREVPPLDDFLKFQIYINIYPSNSIVFKTMDASSPVCPFSSIFFLTYNKISVCEFFEFEHTQLCVNITTVRITTVPSPPNPLLLLLCGHPSLQS